MVFIPICETYSSVRIIPDTTSRGWRDPFDLLRWSLLVFGTKGDCVREPSMSGGSPLLLSACHHRDRGSDLTHGSERGKFWVGFSGPNAGQFLSVTTESWVQE